MKVRAELRQADKAWLALLGVIVVIELVADDDEMLSHGAARYKQSHPVITTAVVCTTAAHLLSWLPPDYDPYHRLFGWLRRGRRQV